MGKCLPSVESQASAFRCNGCTPFLPKSGELMQAESEDHRIGQDLLPYPYLPIPTSRRPAAGSRAVADLANGYGGGFAGDCGSVCKGGCC